MLGKKRCIAGTNRLYPAGEIGLITFASYQSHRVRSGEVSQAFALPIAKIGQSSRVSSTIRKGKHGASREHLTFQFIFSWLAEVGKAHKSLRNRYSSLKAQKDCGEVFQQFAQCMNPYTRSYWIAIYCHHLESLERVILRMAMLCALYRSDACRQLRDFEKGTCRISNSTEFVTVTASACPTFEYNGLIEQHINL